MDSNHLANAIAMIDENILFDVLEERHEKHAHIQKTERHSKSFRHFSLAVATIAAACIFAVILAITNFNNQSPANNLPTNPPQYIPAFSSPDLEALYNETPYANLLPQKIPETLAFVSSYKTEYDPIANPNNERYLSLLFRSEGNASYFEIKITKYDPSSVIADPAKSDSYDLSRYYGYLESNGALRADAPQIIDLFRSDDISEAIAEKRIYRFDDGLCKAEIEILCGDYVVAYHYAGTETSHQLFYEVITSSKYFNGEHFENS